MCAWANPFLWPLAVASTEGAAGHLKCNQARAALCAMHSGSHHLFAFSGSKLKSHRQPVLADGDVGELSLTLTSRAIYTFRPTLLHSSEPRVRRSTTLKQLIEPKREGRRRVRGEKREENVATKFVECPRQDEQPVRLVALLQSLCPSQQACCPVALSPARCLPGGRRRCSNRSGSPRRLTWCHIQQWQGKGDSRRTRIGGDDRGKRPVEKQRGKEGRKGVGHPGRKE